MSVVPSKLLPDRQLGAAKDVITDKIIVMSISPCSMQLLVNIL